MISAASTVHRHSLEEGLHSPQRGGRTDSPQIDQCVSTAEGWAATPLDRAIEFGSFRLYPTRRLLLEGENPVRLGSRGFDILIALVEHAGELVSKDELMARVWPNTFVEECNLKVQVAGLRRALGDRRDSNRYLATIPGRGYRFVAPVTRAGVRSTPVERARHLPTPVGRMIDRADAVAALMAKLSRHRLVTIVGPGGIGKTTVALAVARGLIGASKAGVGFVDLASVRDPVLVPGALADAFGLEICSEHPIAGLIDALRDNRMLLVLDNCEHVIEAAAVLAAELLNGAPGLRILATSREPLRAEAEHVHRLPPLESPPASAGLTAAAALGFPAVQLFVERAAAAFGDFELDDANAPVVADICRKLDGIPLAIELAADRIDAFGLRGLAAHLDDPLHLLTGGRRSALPRHASLRAALDWGHDLLPLRERTVLRCLAVFAGSFTLEAAGAVVASAEITAADVVECIANLVAKSLIAAEVGGAVPCYRLLETTRAYALEKLADSGDLEELERRRAEYSKKAAQPGETGWVAPRHAERSAARGWRIDVVGKARARPPALDAGLGPAPIIPAVPASFHL
jgi:predicted ATPase/DNA-binding winged helix-turn-helix (wHTH) protein